ncbi:trimeric intracellular cation channel family protein [Luteipulveratus flavus]|uniref:Trimeric intracellular cation channel family protein n=1 Tax=Luteipulveratus flavus TaxID=3031728 RepID=A0ABT6CCG1_9MICO|nr:trimeric intracellular cation channel family protein [Luteipulveratus sp. YIM 133296]MDF8265734.1 trimeric intracellular cation channel family protein [Luteipulveratus sp. YIM 133296]
MEHAHLSELNRLLDLTGVLANAILGGLIARQERLDPIGFVTLAVLSGLGGGILRDVLLQAGRPVALTDYAYLLAALAGATISYLANVQGRTWERVWPVVDALALGTWAAVGAQKSLAVGVGWLPAILLGTVTAVGGGAIRDVVVRRVPSVLGGNTLYATCAILASAVLVLCTELSRPSLGLVASTLVGAGLCLLARWRGWFLPDADAWSPAGLVARAGLDRERRQRIAGAVKERTLPRSGRRPPREAEPPRDPDQHAPDQHPPNQHDPEHDQQKE